MTQLKITTRYVPDVRLTVLVTAVVGCCMCSAHEVDRTTEESSIAAALGRVLMAKSDGNGNLALAEDWRVLATANRGELFELLAALDDASPVAANWIVTAADAANARLIDANRPLATERLTEFTLDTRRAFAARRWTLRELIRTVPERTDELLAKLLNDPVAQFRHPAVQQLIDKAERQDEKNEQVKLYQRAIAAARDEDQVRHIVDKLASLGHTTSLAEHFGWVMNWYVTGPFGNAKGHGYDTVYPPERLSLNAGQDIFDFNASYQGESDQVSWSTVAASDKTGEVDLNQAIGQLTEVVGYGAAIVKSPREQEVAIRLRMQNSFKLWLNGRLMMAQPIGHTGNSFDQYSVAAELRKGPNLLVIKSLQVAPPEPHPFFKTWHICVRICDSTGKGLRLKQPAPPNDQEGSR